MVGIGIIGGASYYVSSGTMIGFGTTCAAGRGINLE